MSAENKVVESLKRIIEEEIWDLQEEVKKLKEDNRMEVLQQWVADTSLWMQQDVRRILDIQEGELSSIDEELREIRRRLFAIEEWVKSSLKERDSFQESSSSFQPKAPANEDAIPEQPKDWIPMRQPIKGPIPLKSEQPNKKRKKDTS